MGGGALDSIQLAERVDEHFPKPKSNRGLRQDQGPFHLDELT
jgi:hypothetical protein